MEEQPWCHADEAFRALSGSVFLPPPAYLELLCCKHLQLGLPRLQLVLLLLLQACELVRVIRFHHLDAVLELCNLGSPLLLRGLHLLGMLLCQLSCLCL